jgi:hypothetical protein
VAAERILLTDLSRLLREVVARMIAPYPDLEVVGPLSGRSDDDPGDGDGDGVDVIEAVRRTEPDVVVIGTGRSGFPALLPYLVESRSDVHVVALAGDGHHAYLCKPLGEVSPEGLLAAIRTPNA